MVMAYNLQLYLHNLPVLFFLKNGQYGMGKKMGLQVYIWFFCIGFKKDLMSKQLNLKSIIAFDNRCSQIRQ